MHKYIYYIVTTVKFCSKTFGKATIRMKSIQIHNDMQVIYIQSETHQITSGHNMEILYIICTAAEAKIVYNYMLV